MPSQKRSGAICSGSSYQPGGRASVVADVSSTEGFAAIAVSSHAGLSWPARLASTVGSAFSKFLTPVNSMTKFKQMVGRGTRLAQESGKELVTIVDFTGVTGLFADNTFDGLPSRNVRTPSDDEELPPEPIVEEESDADAESAEVAEPPGDFEIEPGGTLDDPVLDLGDGAIIDDEELEDEIVRRGLKYTVSGIDVTVLGEYPYVVEPDANFQLRAIRIETWAKQQNSRSRI